MNHAGGRKKGSPNSTGKICDGCGLSRSHVLLKVYQRLDKLTGVKLSLTFCAPCARADKETEQAFLPPNMPGGRRRLRRAA